MSTGLQAFLMTAAQVATLGMAFQIYLWRRWVGWIFALAVPMTLAYVDGHYYWGAHNLLGLLP